MKYIFYVIMILSAGLFFSGCEMDQNGRMPDDIKDANAGVLIINSANSDPFINLSNPAAYKVEAEVDLLFEGAFNKIDVVVVFNGDYTKQYVVNTVTSVPSTLTITGQQIIDAIPDLTSGDDIEEGDVFHLFTSIEMPDGTYLPGYTQIGTSALAPSLRNMMEILKEGQAALVVNVPCEFVLNDFLGTMDISEYWAPDLEEDRAEVYLDPDYTGTNVGLIIEPVMWWWDDTWKLKIELSTYDYTVKGNPDSQLMGPNIFSYADPTFSKISGNINTCTGVLTVYVGSMCVSVGCFGGMPITYTIQKAAIGKKSANELIDYGSRLRSFNRIPE